MRIVTPVCFIALLPVVCSSQSLSELQRLLVPRSLDLSPDGSHLWYKIGHQWWVIGTTPNSKPAPADGYQAAESQKLPEVKGTGRLANARRSPDGKRIAYLDAENPAGPLLLFCQCGQAEGGKRRPISRMAIEAFQWAKDSNSFWVVANDGADQPVGRLHLDGRFERVSQGAALRRLGGLTAAHDVVAWVQSDGSHHGTICVTHQGGPPRILFDPNRQTTKWSEAWTQEVVRWKNTHGEELQGILAVPAGGRHLPMIIDPYSNWQNRFLNIGVLGNYMFVRAGFAVFFPDHRAAHIQPERAFGEGYVGASKKRDTVDVLTDDVMTGISELVRRGVADSNRLFLYSSSNGASAINQLLTQTSVFRAAVSHGGISDWLSYYRANQPRGDDTIPNFLGGRKPEDANDLYIRISPIYHAEKIATPLLLAVGEKDSIAGGGSRYKDALAFYEALRKAGKQVGLTVYPGEGHEISNLKTAEQHVRKAIEFFRSAPSER